MQTFDSISRRQWIRSGLATCGFLAAGGLSAISAGAAPAPAGYTRPAGVSDLTRAPGLQTKLIAENSNGEKTYALIFSPGDEIMSGLTAFATHENVIAGHFAAIGSIQHGRFGWFDRAVGAFKDIVIDQQAEVVSMMGDVGLVNGKPAVHTHGAVGYSDGQLRGGHLLEGVIWPTLELFFTAYPTPLVKTVNEPTGLYLFNLQANAEAAR